MLKLGAVDARGYVVLREWLYEWIRRCKASLTARTFCTCRELGINAEILLCTEAMRSNNSAESTILDEEWLERQDISTADIAFVGVSRQSGNTGSIIGI